jgi:hypothetical protein
MFSKVVIHNIANYCDLWSIINLLSTCKKNYSFRKNLAELLNCGDEYKKLPWQFQKSQKYQNELAGHISVFLALTISLRFNLLYKKQKKFFWFCIVLVYIEKTLKLSRIMFLNSTQLDFFFDFLNCQDKREIVKGPFLK